MGRPWRLRRVGGFGRNENRARVGLRWAKCRVASLALLLLLAVPLPSEAATPAGTVITNWAVLTWDGGTVVSNPAYFVVVPFAAEFTAWPTTGPVPLVVVFTDLSTGSPTSWAWDFGDGATSTDQHPTHVYTAPGSYNVTLTVADADHLATVTKNAFITATYPPLAARFSGTPTDGPTPLTVYFTDLSSGEPTSWYWDFGDGQTAVEPDPVHTYGSPGVYTVTLIVFDLLQSDSETKPLYIVAGFSDVPREHWAYSGIMGCLKASIVLGYPDGTYRPQVQITRDQIAVYLARALAGGEGNVPEGPAEPTFGDVPTTYWAYDHIEYVASLGVVLGYPGSPGHPGPMFRPKALVNRAQMAVFLARSLVSPPGEEGLKDYVPPETPTFPDVTPTNSWSWCYKHVEYIASRGVTSGYLDGLYHPADNCTRDQMAVYLARTFGLSP